MDTSLHFVSLSMTNKSLSFWALAKNPKKIKNTPCIYGYFATLSMTGILSFWAFCKKAKNPQKLKAHLLFLDTSLSCESSVWQFDKYDKGFCHFERSALAQSKIHIESVSVVRYLYFVWWENQRFLTKKLDGLTNLATMSKSNKILLKLAKKWKMLAKNEQRK